MRSVPTTTLLVLAAVAGAFAPSGAAQQTTYPIAVGPRQPAPELRVTGSDAGGMTIHAVPTQLDARVRELPQGRFLDFERPAGTTTDVGSPALPVERLLVDVPFGATNVRVEVLGEQWTDHHVSEFEGADFVMPLQPPLPKLPGARQNAKFVIDDGAYRARTLLPEQVVTIEEAGLMRGHRLMCVSIHPVRYNPATGDLSQCTSLDVAVRYESADLEATARIHQRYRSPFFDSLLENNVGNYEPEGASALRGPTASTLPLPIGYLIVTHPNFEAGIQQLADWKSHIGYDVTVVNTNVAGSTASAIRSYIQTAYNTWSVPPQFVLLVGDSGYLPGFQGSTTGSIDDLDYSLMDAGNYFPDLFVSRISVASTTQLQDVLDKLLQYEQLDQTNQPWIQKAVFMASVDNYTISEGTHNYVINNYLNPAGYTSDKLYQVTYGATTADVTNSINNGRSLAVYSGHGGETSWADGPPYSQSDINALSNLDMYPFVCSHACLTGDFETSVCFGETWQRATDKGAIGFWGASTYSYWDQDDILEKGAFHGAFNDGLWFVSGWTNAGLLAVYTYYGGSGLSEYYYEEYNVLSEPSLFLWTEDLYTPSITHENVLPVGSAQLNVSVLRGGTPVEDALVHAYKAGEVDVVAYTDAAGGAVLPINSSTPGNLDVVITAHNAVRHEATVVVFVPSGPYVILSDKVVDDSAGGNNDGAIDVGEAIDLSVAGENVGSVLAAGVIATLTSTDPLVTITDGTATLGDVASGAIVWGADDFQFQVSSFCADGHVLPLTVTFSDGGPGVWQSALNLPVNAPALVVDATTLDDVGGDGDGDADPGETVTIDVILENVGHYVAEGVSVNVHTTDTYCTITQPSSTYADIPVGGTETNAAAFLADVSAGCPVGRTIVVNIDVYRQGTLVGSDQMSFVAGQVPVCLIDLDGNHNSAPTIEACLVQLGVGYDKVLSWPGNLSLYKSLMICLGIYSDNYSLSPTAASALVAFMQAGGNVYMEGGDCWAFDSEASTYCPAFGILPIDDGTGDALDIKGINGTIAEGLQMQYTGDNNWMDHIDNLTGAVRIFRNLTPTYRMGIAYDSGTYRSIGTSFEIGGIGSGAGVNNIDLVTVITDYFGLTSTEPGVAYCSGEVGVGTPCPCSNDNDGSVPGAGCANGVFASGAYLSGTGVASLAADTLVLATTGQEPSNSGLYFQANNNLFPGNVWGDGLQCAGGGLIRIGVRFADATGYSDTSAFAFTISGKVGNITAGDTKYYQCWYRNPAGSPCGNGFNASNGYAVTWAP